MFVLIWTTLLFSVRGITADAVYPTILNSSKCEVQSEVLTCVCISEGFPLPTITWPLLENHTEYSELTDRSNHTFNSTITLTVGSHSYTVVECISRSEVGEVHLEITIIASERPEDPHGPRAELPWIIVAVVALIGNVILLILLLFLCVRRKKVKPNQEDRTYMSARETDQSPEQDVIARPQNEQV